MSLNADMYAVIEMHMLLNKCGLHEYRCGDIEMYKMCCVLGDLWVVQMCCLHIKRNIKRVADLDYLRYTILSRSILHSEY